jgi:hypothetical protein
MGPEMVEAINLHFRKLKKWRLGHGNMGPGNMEPEILESCFLESKRLVPSCH